MASGPIARIVEFHDEMTAWRRDIHAHPELGFEEERTADIVAAKLAEFGCEVTRGLGQTGVVGSLRVGNGTRAIGLRADMDALPMAEANDFDHRSRHDGKMHACGHDGHTAMLLGAARYLAETRDFDGAVHFIFQPAEAGLGGADAMVRDGLFEQFPVDVVFGMHNRPSLPVGQFQIRPGAMMAGGATFDIHITGHGAHGARPEVSVDPVVVAAQITTALQTIVSRNASPHQAAVVSVTRIQGGDAYNIIPASAHLAGTARAFDDELMKLIGERMNRIATGIAEGLGASAEVDFRIMFPALVNHAGETDFIADTAAELVGDDKVNRRGPMIMASEDFSFMLNRRPGAYIQIGGGDERPPVEVHNPAYDFNDETLPFGASLFARLVERHLAKQES